MAKPMLEFLPALERAPWTKPGGDAEGLHELILARDGDSHIATRLLRFEPGATSAPNGVQVHDFWEEIYVIEGSLHDLELDQTFHAGSYACRPPGMRHGPWRSEDGAVLFEVRYRPPAE
jgi:quercetin dioxygenase-like cupin family protein